MSDSKIEIFYFVKLD